MYFESMRMVQKLQQEKKGNLVGQGDWHIQRAKLDAALLRDQAGAKSNGAAYGNN